MTEPPLDVLIAEDQDLVREALGLLLSAYAGLRVVGAAGGVEEALALAAETRPHIALVDLHLPSDGAAGQEDVPNGVEVVAGLRRRSPATRCLILSAFREPGALRAALAAGACGYLVKDTSTARLVAAIRRVAVGELVIDDRLAARIALAKPCPLTPQEVAVLRHAQDVLTVADIARAMRLSTGTVRNYITRAIHKTGARNRHEAVRIAAANDWL
ncbi:MULTISPECIES: response regulator transcription factor [Microbispora]|uniref:Response regulator n=1 Tax=Microbispora catharanthi TaxID=1712871 RepID=A0A5N6C2G3_9ACTN|nr:MULTISPECIES: response regulator transcription factor [Microbispora]KAB8186680.1 response regulator [Microbispora catharanthi]